MIWNTVKYVLKKYDPICILAFLSHHYYGVPLQQVSRVYDVKTSTLLQWFQSISDDVKDEYRARGGLIGGAPGEASGRQIDYSNDTKLIMMDYDEED